MGVFKMKIAPLALSVLFVATSFQPSQAFTPVPQPAPRAVNEPVDLVQYRRDDDWRRHHRYGRRDERRDFSRRSDYWNGHRGYRERRPGYRYHNGLWFPLAAFATGAIIGGAATAAPRSYGSSHVQWCASRYRSYRASDNTYQPNSGPRRQCVSP